MKSRRLRLWLAVIIFCLSCTVLFLSAWPEPRERHSIPLPTLALPTPEAYQRWNGMWGLSA